MEVGADGVELDVRLCASGELVVFHDESLERLLGDPRLVATLSWRELSGMKMQGHGIPLLDEVFAKLPTAFINVELKKTSAALAIPLVRATLAVLTAAQAEARVIVSSFDPRLLALVAMMAPKIPRGLLFAEEQLGPLRKAWLAKALRVSALHPQHTLLNDASFARWSRKGYQINTWTVDSPKEMKRLALMGVSTIITNDPKTAVALLRGP